MTTYLLSRFGRTFAVEAFNLTLARTTASLVYGGSSTQYWAEGVV